MFKYIFGISWKEYCSVMFDLKNALLLLIGLPLFIILFGGWGVLLWIVLMRLMTMGGSIIF